MLRRSSAAPDNFTLPFVIKGKVFDRIACRDLVTWNSMVDGELFDRMPVKNIVSWNTMITGFNKNGRFKEAVIVYEEMLEAGLVPNVVTLEVRAECQDSLRLKVRKRMTQRTTKNHVDIHFPALGEGSAIWFWEDAWLDIDLPCINGAEPTDAGI
ncbi:putative Pentatricopeptide repeat-containing protein [Cocos nucifera]|uniref:Putative Pentatricopeptide repeat-containing protein n=1 Tax=Cocos nucifera TaxID=13894 RepID=A0A8K0I1Z7_COCNU|nr:putative Pentatricopeptide repeat-containing protein [Cocos nucifera]